MLSSDQFKGSAEHSLPRRVGSHNEKMADYSPKCGFINNLLGVLLFLTALGNLDKPILQEATDE
jgi:hypothetical protein